MSLKYETASLELEHSTSPIMKQPGDFDLISVSLEVSPWKLLTEISLFVPKNLNGRDNLEINKCGVMSSL